MGWIVVAVLLAGTALVWLRWRAPAPVGARHPAADMSVEEAATVAYSFAKQARHQESLPYYRRVVDLMGTEWMARVNYSSALHNAAQQSRVHLGQLAPAVRSSAERIAMMTASLHEEDLAEQNAPTEMDRALAVYLRGQTLETWGFPLDALVDYQRAVELSRGDSAMSLGTARLGARLARGGAD